MLPDRMPLSYRSRLHLISVAFCSVAYCLGDISSGGIIIIIIVIVVVDVVIVGVVVVDVVVVIIAYYPLTKLRTADITTSVISNSHKNSLNKVHVIMSP